MKTLVEHTDIDQLSAAVAERLFEDLRDAIVAQGVAAVALAGGSTPQPVYRLLGSKSLDWACVRVVPTDERWVDFDHPDRNSTSISEALRPASPGVVALAPERVAGEPSASCARKNLSALAAPFDHVLVGMGADGHFASLFPGTTGSALDPEGGDDAIVVYPDPMPASAPHSRISLTLARLLRSRRITLAVTGADKRAALERAGRADADPDSLPVAALLRAAGDRLCIHWSPSRSER